MLGNTHNPRSLAEAFGVSHLLDHHKEFAKGLEVDVLHLPRYNITGAVRTATNGRLDLGHDVFQWLGTPCSSVLCCKASEFAPRISRPLMRCFTVAVRIFLNGRLRQHISEMPYFNDRRSVTTAATECYYILSIPHWISVSEKVLRNICS
jgi:hypothetical protein